MTEIGEKIAADLDLTLDMIREKQGGRFMRSVAIEKIVNRLLPHMRGVEIARFLNVKKAVVSYYKHARKRKR